LWVGGHFAAVSPEPSQLGNRAIWLFQVGLPALRVEEKPDQHHDGQSDPDRGEDPKPAVSLTIGPSIHGSLVRLLAPALAPGSATAKSQGSAAGSYRLPLATGHKFRGQCPAPMRSLTVRERAFQQQYPPGHTPAGMRAGSGVTSIIFGPARLHVHGMKLGWPSQSRSVTWLQALSVALRS